MHVSSLIRGVVVCGSLATAGLTSVATWPSFTPATPHEMRRVALDDARPVRGWELRTHRGAAFSERDLVGRWSVVLVGHQRCTSVCPATLQVLTRALDRVAPIQALFLSMDPERQAALGRHVSGHHPDLIGLTGGPSALAHAARSLGARVAPTTTQPGVVEHGATLFLVDPTANVVGVLFEPATPEQVAEDLDALRHDVVRPIHGELWTPRGADPTPDVVYGALESDLEAPVWVVGVSSPDLQGLEMHEPVRQAGVARVVQRRRVALERDRGVDFEPGGLHLVVHGPSLAQPPLIEWTLEGGHRALMLVELRSR